MNIPWEDLQLFLAIAETGSLSRAARQLRVGQPTVSRRLAALEYQVGTALFLRKVDGVSLTLAGERLVAPSKRMAEWAGEASRAASSVDPGLSGQVRVTAAPAACFYVLAPFAALLADKHPGLRLELLSSVQYLDLGRGEADLALRGLAPTQPELTTVCTIEVENVVLASKALAAKAPKHPQLKDLPWIGWSPPYDSIPPQPQLAAAIPGFQPALTSDNFLVHLAAAEAGVGAVLLWRTLPPFAGPRGLVEVPIDLGPWRTSTMHLVCARSALDIPRVRAVAQLLGAELRLLERRKAR
jgi:DNA-binding transcriptional LysR family regulator